MNIKLIDIHAHAFPEKIAEKAVAQLQEHYGLPIRNKGTIESVKAAGMEIGASTIVVQAAATRPHQVQPNNDWLSQTVKDDPTLLGFGSVHPEYEDIPAEIYRMKELGLSGIKLHPDFQGFDADDPSAYIIYRTALEAGFPVMIHAGDLRLDHSHPKRIAKVVKNFPELTIIAAHLGGYSKWQDAREELGTLVADHPNLYVDTSSSACFLPKDVIMLQMETFGIDRILFGTDYPLKRHKGEVELLLSLSLKHWEMESILYGNSARLLGLTNRFSSANLSVENVENQ